MILLPLGAATWALVHASGIHATVAGVLLGFAVPVLRSQASGGPEAGPGLAEIFEHRFRPISAGFAVPVFAFFSAGVAVGGWKGLGVGPDGPGGRGHHPGPGPRQTGRHPRHHLAASPRPPGPAGQPFKWIDVFGLSILAGIGFTVSLLVAELSFGHGTLHDDHAKVGILAASVLAALLAAACCGPATGSTAGGGGGKDRLGPRRHPGRLPAGRPRG